MRLEIFDQIAPDLGDILINFFQTNSSGEGLASLPGSIEGTAQDPSPRLCVWLGAD